MIGLQEAQLNVRDATDAFDRATERLLSACQRQAALEIAVKRWGIRPGDAIISEIDKELASASMALWDARQARDDAAAALKLAQHPPMRPLLERQLAIVAEHAPVLYQRYLREVAAIDEAPTPEDVWRARHVMGQTRQMIVRYQVPQEVA